MLLIHDNLPKFPISPKTHFSREMLPELKPVPLKIDRYHKMEEGSFVAFDDGFVGRVFRNPVAARRYISNEKVCAFDGSDWTILIEPRWLVTPNSYFKLCRILHGITDTLSDKQYTFLKTFVGIGKILECDFQTAEEQDRIITVIRNEFRYRSMSRFACQRK